MMKKFTEWLNEIGISQTTLVPPSGSEELGPGSKVTVNLGKGASFVGTIIRTEGDQAIVRDSSGEEKVVDINMLSAAPNM